MSDEGNDDPLLTDWEENGFLILENFFTAEEIAAVRDEIALFYRNRAAIAGETTIDILEGELTGQRIRLREAPEQAIECVHKVNDLYLESETYRRTILSRRLTQVLKRLLGDEPVVINSLSFRKGSQQPYHFDTFFMPPPVENMMAVSSICLEDQSPDAGPLSYYPGSHKIPPYRFSHGKISAIEDEMPAAEDYVREQLGNRNLQAESFIGKTGDVFIWHAQLLHGGLPILDPASTRRTLVTHYWRKGDIDPDAIGTDAAGGCYLRRGHQRV